MTGKIFCNTMQWLGTLFIHSTIYLFTTLARYNTTSNNNNSWKITIYPNREPHNFPLVHLNLYTIINCCFYTHTGVSSAKIFCMDFTAENIIGVKVPSTSSLSVYTKVLAHNLNDIRNWASLIGLLFRICWCLLSVFLIYCSDEWKKLVNLIYCFQVLFRMNFKIMYFLMKILGNTPSADSAASRDSLSSQNAT